jgi:hypothetical protein
VTEENDITVVGDVPPEVAEWIRQAKREQSYFNNPDATDETHVEQISRMEADPVMALVTGEDPETFDGFDTDASSDG